MSELVADCPRCGARQITVDVLASHQTGIEHGWLTWHDAFSVCRNCDRTTVFILKLGDYDSRGIATKPGIPNVHDALNKYFSIEGYRTLKDTVHVTAPEHVPAAIVAAFDEAATCIAVNCFNAAGTMFRLCIDHATRSLLPEADEDGLNRQIRRSLGLRVEWLLNHHRLPEALRELSVCIKEDGNDGAHAGTLSKAEAEDLSDFTVVLLERLYTEPERLREAQERRQARRK